MNITVIGLDIAKQIFHLVGLDKMGHRVLKKKLRRATLLSYFANLPPCMIGLEACAASHYWSRELKKLGHQVKLLPPQYVKPYVRGNKNDYNDALGIAEASRVPELRTVAAKTIEQQSIQALHRMRRRTVADRTALGNQLRGLLSEFGIIFNQGLSTLRKKVPEILEDAQNELLPVFRHALALKYEQLCQLDALEAQLMTLIKDAGKHHQEIKLLQSIPGYGAVVSSAFFSVIGDGRAFKNGRDASASLGVVPRQHSSGDKTKLLGITKRGDKYLRSLLVHGARAVVKHAHKKDDKLSVWVTRLVERRGKNKATVALANKLTRIGWAVITSQQPYQANFIK